MENNPFSLLHIFREISPQANLSVFPLFLLFAFEVRFKHEFRFCIIFSCAIDFLFYQNLYFLAVSKLLKVSIMLNILLRKIYETAAVVVVFYCTQQNKYESINHEILVQFKFASYRNLNNLSNQISPDFPSQLNRHSPLDVFAHALINIQFKTF